MGNTCCICTHPQEADSSGTKSCYYREQNAKSLRQLISNQNFVQIYLEGRWNQDIQVAFNELKQIDNRPRFSISDGTSAVESSQTFTKD